MDSYRDGVGDHEDVCENVQIMQIFWNDHEMISFVNTHEMMVLVRNLGPYSIFHIPYSIFIFMFHMYVYIPYLYFHISWSVFHEGGREVIRDERTHDDHT